MRPEILRGLVEGSVGAFEATMVTRMRLENRFPPLFIVGAPRSGTTLPYQYLMNRFRFAYFPNLSKWYPRSCVTAAAVARLLGQPATTYTSRFGIMKGATAPSDGWDVFHRWFPRYDYSVPIDEAHLHELRTIVRLVERLYGAPLLNKNNSHSVRIRPLSQLFPRALFVHVDRDWPSTVDSLLRGRRTHDVPPDAWWGAPPPQDWDRSFENETERVVAQVRGLRESIRAELDALPDRRWTEIRYESFCARPAGLAEWVRSAYEQWDIALEQRDGPLPSSFGPRQSARAGDPAFRRRLETVSQRLQGERGRASSRDMERGRNG